MARAKKKKKNSKNSFKIPWSILGWGALIAGVFLFFALISHNPADPTAFSRASGLKTLNYMGLTGAWASHQLVKLFGLGAFWPLALLAACAWMILRKVPVSQNTLFKIAGSSLFLFAGLTILSMGWPKINSPWPGISGGGAFGLFLARGATGLLGHVGSWLTLPVLALTGLFLALPCVWRGCCGLSGSMWENFCRKREEARLRKEEARLKALEEEAASPPLIHKAEPEDPEEDEPDSVDDEYFDEPIEVKIIENNPAALKKSVPSPEPARPARREPGGPYKLPPTSFLDAPPPGKGGHSSGLSREELMENAHLLEAKLRDFGVDGRVLEVSGGPVITMYEYQPAPGIKISKVAGLADDVTMAMRATSIRVVAPLPGKAAIGIEIPNPKRSLVTFREVVESPAFQDSKSLLSLVLGVDIMGEPVVADLAKMPHLLIAGATGSGKSVGLGAMIMSILYKAPPDKVRFLMIDPKCVELALYKDIPHLIYPVLSDPTEATLGLKWAVAEMDQRYKVLAQKGVRNIETFNEKVREELKTWKAPAYDPESGEPEPEAPKEMPFLVIIIDELADLMMVAAKEVEVYITRLAQKARACGIHLILATQRPSVDVLTGIIKANMPTRISFQVSSRIDSRTILDQMGAEKLLGAGDMLFLPPGVGKLRRLHGAYVSDDEIKAVTDFIRDWGPPDYLEDLALPEAEGGGEGDGEKDEKYEEAIELVRRTQKATISHVQRHLRIGYNRAARIIEDMEHDGVIGPADGVRPRVIL